MAHRVFRLSINPERAPGVRRVIDFDGRATLHDVHDAVQRELDLDDDHPYAFYLSGAYFDRSSEYGLGSDSRHDAQRSPLFRLELNEGQKFAYLFDFGDELRHAITVVSITDVEAPLAEPVLVESVGEAPTQYEDDKDDEPYELPEHLTEVAPLAEAVLELSEQLDQLYEEDDLEAEAEDDDEGTGEDAPAGPPEKIRSLVVQVSKAALELAKALEEDEEALGELDEWSRDRELLPRLVELPLGLVAVGELDSALAVARAFRFGAAESFDADIAVILAESGKRDEAIAKVESNLKQFPESYVTAIKSGAAFEALGDMAAAEASYRRSLTLAEDGDEEEGARSELIGLLEDLGRIEEAEALLSPEADEMSPVAVSTPIAAKPFAPVGRNDACPCGSGKKYKKCHGA